MHADLRRIAGLMPGITLDDLYEFFNATDRTRTSMVARRDFVRGISECLMVV